MDNAINSDKVMQVVFFVEGEDLKEEVEEMEGFEKGDWNHLKREMVA